MIFRSPLDMGSKPLIPKKKNPNYRFSSCNLVDFVMNKTREREEFFMFTSPPPPHVSPSLVYELLYFFYNCNENLILTIKSKVILVTCSCQCCFLPTEVDYLGQLLNLLETHKNTIQTNALGLPEGGRCMYRNL